MSPITVRGTAWWAAQISTHQPAALSNFCLDRVALDKQRAIRVPPTSEYLVRTLAADPNGVGRFLEVQPAFNKADHVSEAGRTLRYGPGKPTVEVVVSVVPRVFGLDGSLLSLRGLFTVWEPLDIDGPNVGEPGLALVLLDSVGPVERATDVEQFALGVDSVQVARPCHAALPDVVASRRVATSTSNTRANSVRVSSRGF